MSGKVLYSIVQDGLILRLDAANTKSYVSGSTIWNDLTSNQKNGLLVNGPGFNSNNLGSITFDASNDHVNLGQNFNFTTEDFTISYWVYFNGFVAGGGPSQGPILIYKGPFQVSGFYDQVPYTTGSTAAGISFLTNNLGSTNITTAAYSLSSSTWYNISYTRSGTSVRIYINGVDSTSSLGTHTITSSTKDFYLMRYSNQSGSANLYSNGRLSNVLIYNKQLTANEILQNYNALKIRYGLT